MPKGKSAKFNFRKIVLGNFVQAAIFAFPYLVSFGFTGALFGASYAFAVQSDLFTLNKVALEDGRPLVPDVAYRFAGLRIGGPILPVDLVRSEKVIRSRHPEYRWVVVKRVLPNEIRIVLREKSPLAQIHYESYYLIDHSGMVISEASAEPFKKLAVIRGIDVGRKLQRGMRLDRHSMNQVIQLLRDIQRFNVLRGHQLTAVDMGDRRNLLLWIDEKIEVRISSRNVVAQLKKFSDWLASVELDPEKIRYIDLRFEDIVVGPR